MAFNMVLWFNSWIDSLFAYILLESEMWCIFYVKCLINLHILIPSTMEKKVMW